MAFCTNCGTKLEPNQKFCTECGAAQPVRTPAAAPGRNVPPQNRKAQFPAQTPDPAAQRPGQPGGPGYTTYLPRSAPAVSEQTIYIPRRPEAAPPRQGYAAPRQNVPAPQPNAAPPRQNPAPAQQSYTVPQQNPAPARQSNSMSAQQPTEVQSGICVDPGRKPGKGKKTLIVLLVLAVLAALGTGAFFLLKDGFPLGGTADADDNSAVLGVYGAVDDRGDDIRGDWLELQERSRGELRLDGERYKFRWELDGEDLTIIQAKDEYTGTLIDKEIILNINGESYIYRHDDWTPPEEDSEPAAPTAPDPDIAADPNTLDFWEGDYYGWWIISKVHKGDPEWKGKWWDCAASVTFNDDGTAWMIFWDENTSKSAPLAKVKMDIKLVDPGVVEFSSISGTFDGCRIEFGDWGCRSDDDEYDQTFYVLATYDDGADRCFEYTFYMRPWGHDWKDIAGKDPELLPRYYEDWYLRLLEDGIREAPDTIN